MLLGDYENDALVVCRSFCATALASVPLPSAHIAARSRCWRGSCAGIEAARECRNMTQRFFGSAQRWSTTNTSATVNGRHASGGTLRLSRTRVSRARKPGGEVVDGN